MAWSCSDCEKDKCTSCQDELDGCRHIMERRTEPRDDTNRNCDVCFEHIAARSWVYHCGPCDNDICQSCATALDNKIVSINFKSENAKIQNKKTIDCQTIPWTNCQKKTANKHEYTYNCTVTKLKSQKHSCTQTWGTKIGMKTEFSAGVPLTVSTKIDFSVEASFGGTRGVEWSFSNSHTTSRQYHFTTNVPPMTKTIFTVMATQADVVIPVQYCSWNGRVVAQDQLKIECVGDVQVKTEERAL